jgi:biotin transport system substrate-specific component
MEGENVNTSTEIRKTVYASLFAALIAVGAFLSIPVGPVPIVLQNFFVLLAGLTLGPRWGLLSVAAYLITGAVGLPVFAQGTGGIGRIIGPTGGYLLGYLPAVAAAGALSHIHKKRWYLDLAGAICGSLIVYACGVPWLKMVAGLSWQAAVGAGMLPFLIGDAVKIAAAVWVVRAIRPVFRA